MALRTSPVVEGLGDAPDGRLHEAHLARLRAHRRGAIALALGSSVGGLVQESSGGGR